MFIPNNERISMAIRINFNFYILFIFLLFSCSSQQIRDEKASQDVTTTPEILEKLANNSNVIIRSNVAKNKNTSPEILAKLSEDYEWLVRRNVALNPKTPDNILIRLANDKDSLVRNTVKTNENAPKEAIKIVQNLEKEEDSKNYSQKPIFNASSTINEEKKVILKQEFFGIKIINDLGVSAFNVKGKDNDIIKYTHNPSYSNTDIYANATVLWNNTKIDSIQIIICNSSKNPFKFNYFSDEFAIYDIEGNTYILEKPEDFTKYPSKYLNPKDTEAIHLTAPLTAKTLKKGEIKALATSFSIPKILLVLKPIP